MDKFFLFQKQEYISHALVIEIIKLFFLEKIQIYLFYFFWFRSEVIYFAKLCLGLQSLKTFNSFSKYNILLTNNIQFSTTFLPMDTSLLCVLFLVAFSLLLRITIVIVILCYVLTDGKLNINGERQIWSSKSSQDDDFQGDIQSSSSL